MKNKIVEVMAKMDGVQEIFDRCPHTTMYEQHNLPSRVWLYYYVNLGRPTILQPCERHLSNYLKGDWIIYFIEEESNEKSLSKKFQHQEHRI